MVYCKVKVEGIDARAVTPKANPVALACDANEGVHTLVEFDNAGICITVVPVRKGERVCSHSSRAITPNAIAAVLAYN